MTVEFKTTHNLEFQIAHWIFQDFIRFRIGTCHGLWRSTDDAYEILAVNNDQPGNGHFNDVLEWFEHSCKRDGKALMILEVWNKMFAKHLATKRGFTYQSEDNLIKRFK